MLWLLLPLSNAVFMNSWQLRAVLPPMVDGAPFKLQSLIGPVQVAPVSAARIKLFGVMKPKTLKFGIVHPAGGVPINIAASPGTLPCSTLSCMVAIWTESMLAMFVALEPVSQLARADLFLAKVSVKSRSVPFELRRCSAVSTVKSPGTNCAWPFLFCQKPSVLPLLVPMQTLPKSLLGESGGSIKLPIIVGFNGSIIAFTSSLEAPVGVQGGGRSGKISQTL